MATYPIKMLKDEQNIPFVPLVSTEGIQDPEGLTLEQRLSTKLGPTNLHGGTNISVRTEGYDCYIDLDLPSSLTVIDNLTTSTSGQGALDAHQGYVLKDMIDNLPIVIDDITSTSTTDALSANQGRILNGKIPTVNNTLTSTSTTQALSANQGKILNDKFANYLPLTGGTVNGTISANYLKANLDSGEAKVLASYQNKGIYLFANETTHGIYDSSFGGVMALTGTGIADKKFYGTASMAQQDISGFDLSGAIIGGDAGGDNFYIKCSNGILICVKRVSFSNLPISTAWGGLYEYNGSVSLGDWPYTFAFTPATSVTIQSQSGLLLEGHQSVSSSSAGTVWMSRPTASSGVSGYISVIAIGKWIYDIPTPPEPPELPEL